MGRITAYVLLSPLLLRAQAATGEPAFPWTSLRVMVAEHSIAGIGVCNPYDDGTRLTALLIGRGSGFYRFWAVLNGPAWLAIHYDDEARPDWVWRGSWAGDRLQVASVSPYDPAAHPSACEILFEAGP